MNVTSSPIYWTCVATGLQATPYANSDYEDYEFSKVNLSPWVGARHAMPLQHLQPSQSRLALIFANC
jgi:hypothetical protein